MSVDDFINFNNHCPMCNNKLTLYLQIKDSACLKAEMVDEGYHFTPFFNYDTRLSSEDKMILSNHRIITSKSLREVLNDNVFFLFYLCKNEGFVQERSDYYISLYHGCYNRSSCDFKLDNNMIIPCEFSINKNANESFSITSLDQNKDIEKVFGLNFDYDKDVTNFYFYSSSQKDRNSENFEPNIFEKCMPMMPNRPSFSEGGKEKLIQKMESWIMMS